MKNKILILILIGIIIVMAGFSIIGYIQTNKVESKGEMTLKITVLGSSTEKKYEFENLTALELLQEDNIVNLTYSRYGAFVSCINNICSNNDYFWMYYADNSLAPVGADAYWVKNNETIEFRYDKMG